ncbi:hypothetical protein [Nonomuraea salmonea]|uniref:hypothetical protein n=1 Tax=Nonomuraea salmonea TaxID=46181 RepID=UPI0031E6F03F
MCADFPEPQPQPGRAPVRLVGAGLHHVVRGMATGRHYRSGDAFPLVPGVDAVARTEDGRLVYTGLPRGPWGTMAESMVTPFEVEVPEGADPLAVAAGMNPASAGWMPLAAHREETGGLGTVLVLGATGMSGGLAVRAAVALGAKQVIAAGRDRAALEPLAGVGALTVPLTQDGALDALAPRARRDAAHADPRLRVGLGGRGRLRRSGRFPPRRGRRDDLIRADRLARRERHGAARGAAAQPAVPGHRQRARLGLQGRHDHRVPPR